MFHRLMPRLVSLRRLPAPTASNNAFRLYRSHIVVVVNPLTNFFHAVYMVPEQHILPESSMIVSGSRRYKSRLKPRPGFRLVSRRVVQERGLVLSDPVRTCAFGEYSNSRMLVRRIASEQ